MNPRRLNVTFVLLLLASTGGALAQYRHALAIDSTLAPARQRVNELTPNRSHR